MMQSFPEYLPREVVALIRTSVSAEFATVSAAGVPIDTPTFFFPNASLTSLDVGTGVAYPAKAERARRNPKAGMLIEGRPNQPVVSIAGHAVVRDADIQANLERYLAETIFAPNVDPQVVPWEKTRRRLYYLSRIIVQVIPVHVRWWPNRAAMDQSPHEWRAPSAYQLPKSDPSPKGKASRAPDWPQVSWPELAVQAVASNAPAHLTLLDSEGFPVPIRVRDYQRSDGGFRLTVPKGAPWCTGKATLSFFGKEIFVGDLKAEGGGFFLEVERALPILPMMNDRAGMSSEVLETLNDRLAHEMQRRGQPVPVVPEVPPVPTAGAVLRAAAAKSIDATTIGAGISR